MRCSRFGIARAMRRWQWMLLACLLMLMPGALRALGAPPSAPVRRPTTAIAQANCVTAECHVDIKQGPILHAPVAANACDSCHELTDAQKHSFVVRRQKAELCTYCHEFSVKGMPAIHKPVAEGQCLGCHDPHGGATRALTLEQSLADLCKRCHESVTRDKAFVHGPVAQGACDTCHPPHAAKFPKLLDAVGSDLCLTCHKEIVAGLKSARETHKALEQGCEKCHDVHGSNTPMELRAPVPDLCLGCHKKLKETVEAANVPHSVVMKDRACLTCHTPHDSQVGKLLVALPAVTCLKCHDKPVKAAGGRTIAGVPEIADPKLYKHGEIRDGQCSGCHAVHGGEREFLLVKPFPQGLYEKFTPETYALCFGCHDVQLAQAATTQKATNFRNGDKNLHVVHVVTGSRERSCGACHQTHAGANQKLIHDTLNYGKWNVPMAFAQSADGGSCGASCHASYAYDRIRVVPTTGPASKPAPVAPRAQPEDAQMVRWSTRDVIGAAVKVPDSAGRPTLLAFPPADHAAEGAFAETLRQTVGHAEDTQLVLVLSGSGAARRASALAAKQKGTLAPMRIVADEKGDATGALKVRGWPLVIVLKPDGLEVVRLSGDASLLAITLPAYLDVAVGKAGPATLPGSTTLPATDDELAKRTLRDVRIARTLLEEKRPAEALEFLDRDAAALGHSLDAQQLRVSALLRLKRSAEALAILDALPKTPDQPPELAMLRGAALIAQGKWDAAKTLLEGCIGAVPDAAEAHRLLGEVYEHEKDWPKAAEHYRAASEGK